MKILAYADCISAAPGELVNVMVSCTEPAYEASLVRVIQGDINPDGPDYREEPLPLDLGGPFPGRFQPIHTGSYARIEDHALLQTHSSFAFVAAVQPTLPGARPQTIAARRDPRSGAGFELGLDGDGALVFTCDGDRIGTGKPMVAGRWYAVAGMRDAGAGRLTVCQRPLDPCPRVDDGGSASGSLQAAATEARCSAALLFAARPAADGATERHFNGRIEGPRLLSRPVHEDELVTLPGAEGLNAPELVAAWDFSREIPSDRILDVSPNCLHGRLINLPTRGVTGHRWDGRHHDWSCCAEHHGAIHFHDDDLYDAGWEPDFSFRVPGDVRSGVHAIRLQADDDEFHVPLVIRPPAGKSTAPVALLLPTASYMAYANNRIGLDVPETEIVCGRLIELTPADLFMQEHPELGLCFYDLHNDGSGVYYSSRLRPMVNMQPKFIGKLGGKGSNVWQFNADTHIVGWLEKLGQDYDVITDEDLHREGISLIEPYRTLVTGTHPEYTSRSMLDALEACLERGGRLMYLGGNGFYWRISWHPDLPGVIECRKSEDGIRAFAPGPGEYRASFTGEYTGLWQRNGRPPNRLVGVGMAAQGMDVSSPYQRTAASRNARAAFVFEGIEEETIGDFGLSGGGAAGIEVDAANSEHGTPPHALVLASSTRHTDVYLMTPEEMLDPVPGLGGTEAPSIRADMVFFETPEGGAVFSTGSIAWAGAMAWNDYDNHVARISENVLRRFLDPTPL